MPQFRKQGPIRANPSQPHPKFALRFPIRKRQAAALRIVKHEGEAGYYLIRLDAEGKAMTDTFHLSIEDALAQAEWEYRVKQDDWE